MSNKFIISGGHGLEGEYPIQGSKNAALPIISAALLSPVAVRLDNVPRIIDVENLLHLVEAVGIGVEWERGSLFMSPNGLRSAELPDHWVERLRGSLLLLGPLAARFDRVQCVSPGGCPIGRRSFEAHWRVFRAAGYSVEEGGGEIMISRETPVDKPTVYLEESSVTATETALLLFAALGRGRIENPAREPHVLGLIEFLKKLGCEIELHPLFYEVRGGVNLDEESVEFAIPADYIDAGTIAIAAAVTGGSITMAGATHSDILGFQGVLEGFGVNLEEKGEARFRIRAEPERTNPEQLTAGLWPSFPTDLVSLAIVLATQGKGLCLVHDWLYESRMFFIDKLVRMGANVTMCDPHRVMVEGPKRLRGTRLESPDIRAGMALVVAGLCADGETTIEHAEVIERGYEDVAARLNGLGAMISEERV